MPHSFGYRARTRYLFSRAFRRHGPLHLSTYLTTFKIGDIVDIKGDGAIHRGLPHKYYHGRTGRVWNVTKRAVGVEVMKTVGNRLIKKRLHVRIEHVKKSHSREAFVARIRETDKLKQEAKKAGQPTPVTKRFPESPAAGFTISTFEGGNVTNLAPVEYVFSV
eukprot:TRINITY_DN15918_c0_g1_i1.p2 TRINITY_DN15918_c0_g1~~TRINITY_DN15918_c0_g1_i1.p2  ORF type:complete len:163 (+),score=24.12 TRINITY_DN15918_c0_g1_i1:116-604(+)